MKVWYGYGSEHSSNLVMIGHFKEVQDATKAKQVVEWLTKQVQEDVEAGRMTIGAGAERFTDGMLEILRKVNTYSIRPAEMEIFVYDFDVKVDGDKLILTTEEIDVTALLKVIVDLGGRVEVFSAHDYPGTPYGRGK